MKVDTRPTVSAVTAQTTEVLRANRNESGGIAAAVTKGLRRGRTTRFVRRVRVLAFESAF